VSEFAGKERLVLKILPALVFSTLAGVLGGCGSSVSFSEHDDMHYSTTAGSYGVFDLYQPPYDAGRARPAVVAIHGGAWTTGDKDWGRKVATELCPSGFVVVSINYRLAPASVWPAQLEDCQEAVRYVRSHGGALGIDPDRVAALGISAGGQLASMLALRDDTAAVQSSWQRVRAGVSVEGESDLTDPSAMSNQVSILESLFGGVPTETQLLDGSPIQFVRRDAALLLVHSVGDTNVYWTQSEKLSKALLLAGADTQFVSLSGSEHDEAIFDPAMIESARSFLSLRLQPAQGGVSASLDRQITSVESKF
jgi:acetyl esterase/lipase